MTALASGQQAKSLSEQFLVDCDHNCGDYRGEDGCDQGCGGGLQPNAYKYIIAQGGQPSESSYPYTSGSGRNGKCKKGESAAEKISGWEFISEDETEMASWLATNGPMSIAADAAHWSFYDGGIMKSRTVCPRKPQLDHGVNIVGFGEEGSTKYWIIRNSWAADWGEDGYCRTLRGEGTASKPGFCGVNLFATYAKP